MIQLEQLQRQFNERAALEKRKPQVWQLYIPVYHEDGDVVDIYLRERSDGSIRVSDGAMSLMRLSYSLNVHTSARERILERILSENGVCIRDGEIYLDTAPDELYPAVMQIVQVQLKVNNMELYRRETIQDLFYELLDEFIMAQLGRYHPRHVFFPLPRRDDLEVDYRLCAGPRDLFLFGVKDSAKARLVTISALEFQRNQVPHRSIVVHEDFDSLSRKDRSRLTSAVDKQFTSLEDFTRNAEQYLEREAA